MWNLDGNEKTRQSKASKASKAGGSGEGVWPGWTDRLGPNLTAVIAVTAVDGSHKIPSLSLMLITSLDASTHGTIIIQIGLGRESVNR